VEAGVLRKQPLLGCWYGAVSETPAARTYNWKDSSPAVAVCCTLQVRAYSTSSRRSRCRNITKRNTRTPLIGFLL
jgi:hypothetical protein